MEVSLYYWNEDWSYSEKFSSYSPEVSWMDSDAKVGLMIGFRPNEPTNQLDNGN